MEFELLGSESVGPKLRLDHERFAYAGKFVMSRTGKAVAREDGDIIGAVAFSTDVEDDATVHLRYVTVREDRRGAGIGPRLLRFTAEKLDDEFERTVIAVNNPIAYQACYRAGFVFTGRETGIAEFVMRYAPERGSDRETERYQDGFERYLDREIPSPHQRLCEQHVTDQPPSVVDVLSQ